MTNTAVKMTSPADEGVQADTPEQLESDNAGPTLEAPDDNVAADIWASVDESLDPDGDAPTETVEAEETPEPDEATQGEDEPPPAEPQPEAEEPAPAEEQPSEPEPEPAGQQVDVEQLWRDREQALVENFSLGEDEADNIISDPREHLPRLFARVEARAERVIWDNLNAVLPQTINQVMERTQREQQVQDRFFEAWPQVRDHVEKNPEARQNLQTMREMFEQMPQAKKMTDEQKIKQVGAAAVAAFGLPFETEQPPAAPQPKPKLGQPQAATGPARAAGRKPAGTRAASSDPGKQLGAFEALDQELETEPDDASRGATIF